LEIRRRTNAQAALFPVVAGGDENVEVAPICASVGAAEERSPVRMIPTWPPGHRGVQVESAVEHRGVEAKCPAIDIKVATVGEICASVGVASG
jgi:hypothetical protein